MGFARASPSSSSASVLVQPDVGFSLIPGPSVRFLVRSHFAEAGTLPENPSELLLTEKLKSLLRYLEDIFDVIIIDSAPASLLSDAYVLSPMCNTTLYVVKHGFTPKSYLERLDEETNSENQLTNMKIVFNGIRSRGFLKNGYGYGYGYGYIHNNSVKRKMKRSFEEKQN